MPLPQIGTHVICVETRACNLLLRVFFVCQKRLAFESNRLQRAAHLLGDVCRVVACTFLRADVRFGIFHRLAYLAERLFHRKAQAQLGFEIGLQLRQGRPARADAFLDRLQLLRQTLLLFLQASPCGFAGGQARRQVLLLSVEPVVLVARLRSGGARGLELRFRARALRQQHLPLAAEQFALLLRPRQRLARLRQVFGFGCDLFLNVGGFCRHALVARIGFFLLHPAHPVVRLELAQRVTHLRHPAAQGFALLLELDYLFPSFDDMAFELGQAVFGMLEIDA